MHPDIHLDIITAMNIELDINNIIKNRLKSMMKQRNEIVENAKIDR